MVEGTPSPSHAFLSLPLCFGGLPLSQELPLSEVVALGSHACTGLLHLLAKDDWIRVGTWLRNCHSSSEESVLASASFQWLLATPGIPWLLEASLHVCFCLHKAIFLCGYAQMLLLD